MPLVHLSAEDKSKAMESASSDLKWLLADNDVSEDIQAVLFHVGVRHMKIFSGLGESRAEVRTALKADIGL